MMLRTLIYIIAVTANVFFVESFEANKCEKHCEKPNEVYELCPAKCPFRTCGIDDRLIDCIPPPQVGDPNCPPPACRCKSGFYRDDKGNCVKWEDCPVCENPNEEYDACPAPCPLQKCGVDNEVTDCEKPPQLGDPECKPGCRCKDNYVRNDKGTCIPRDQCPKQSCDSDQCTGANEEYVECPDCSTQTCDSIGKTNNCPLETTDNCTPSCRCKSGFYRDANNVCIPEDDCQNQLKCKKNEVYVECPTLCQPQTCDQYGTIIFCPAQYVNGTCVAKPACICQDGYLRNKKGVCIPKEECTTCGGDPNAKPGCGINCNRHCSDYDKEPMSCIALCRDNACDCKENFVLDGNTGKCVKPENCSPTCQVNEVYSECTQGVCRAQNCTQRGEPVPCPGILAGSCIKGCVCAENYLRVSNGTCVPENECDVCPEGEVLNKCPPINCDADEYCRTSRDDPNSCPKSKECGKPKCVCGYLDRRDRNTGKCVIAYECPPFPCNTGNETYQSCPSTCPGENCSDYLHNSTCPIFRIGIVVPCEPMCKCNEGFYRNSSGICVDSSQCTECPDGEIYSSCPPAQCDAEYCPMSRDDPLNCTSTKECSRPRCLCGFNRHRDRLTGKCIATSSCPPFPCDGPHEVFDSCPPVCPGQNCSDYINNSTCPKFKIGIVVPCKPACRCEKGYYRDPNGVCVSSSECEALTTTTPPPTSNSPDSDCKDKCKENEEYVDCPSATCLPQKCSEAGFPIKCPKTNGRCADKPGCICVDGYLRNAKGVCIPKQDCPSCGGDKNARPGCGVNCGKLCTTYKVKNPICAEICNLNGCDCINDTVYDENTKKCVSRDECQCPDGEIYSSCPPAQCDAEYCPMSSDDPLNCTSTKECSRPRCLCGFNRHRDRLTGKCIATSSCPPFPCDGPHEVFDSCPPVCPGQNCSDYINNSTCPKFKIGIVVPCKPACRCEKGYYRDPNGVCVSSSECEALTTTTPPPTSNPPDSDCKDKCKENEEYVDCPSATCLPQKCSEAGFPIKCPKTNGRCADKPGCICVDGYLRNAKGVCIPKQDCPSCGGDKNARPGCGVNCGKLCTTYKVKNPICAEICNLNGCDCINDTVYDENTKKCVSRDECPCDTTTTTPAPDSSCED